MTSVSLDHISMRFDKTVAVDDVSLQIKPGELFFLLGPSGCGKSTLLRLIAGLLQPTAGQIFFNDRDVTRLPTEKRNAVMCFQSYALWPHMTVAQNVAFGLSVRGSSSKQQSERIAEVLRLVRMNDYAQRKPNELSGGQQQRIALARALSVTPDCLLLDEPLSNLDAKLRSEMRSEIRRICKSAGFTTIYVTHDQKEALSVADRIAVMNAGKIAQIGTPSELYHYPQSSFVASFIGDTNLIPGQVLEAGQSTRIQTPIGTITAAAPSPGSQVLVCIRPEQIRISAEPSSANHFKGRVLETTFLGEATEHRIEINNHALRVIAAPPQFQLAGDVEIEFDPEDVIVLNR